MILIGGTTRLTQSGLSMVDWKPLLGIIPPINNAQWQASFNEYKKYPEYQKINQFKHMNLSEYKSIYYWEYMHRLFGRLLGLLFIIPPILFFKKNYISKKMFLHCIVCMFIVTSQGLLGWFMVKSGLVDDPHVSHYRLTAHLFLAFLLMGYSYWLKFRLEKEKSDIPCVKSSCFHINMIFILYVIQVLFGAFIAGTKAGLLWNTFPLMEGRLIPDGLLVLEPLYDNFLNNMKMFQFCHRLIGTALFLYAGLFFYTTRDEIYNKYTHFLFMLLLIQFYIGIMTLLLKVPVFLGVVHQGVAVLILLMILHIKFLLSDTEPIN
tara:strand:- start:22562 stop:23521 length:960 start_codon:yes stop_codon:yes gene_type:complete